MSESRALLNPFLLKKEANAFVFRGKTVILQFESRNIRLLTHKYSHNYAKRKEA